MNTGSVPSPPSPPRVLFVANDPLGGTVTRYRCENLAAVLRTAGWEADVVYVGQAKVRVAHDVVVLHRICRNAEGNRYLRAARACGATVVYGADDLVFAADAFPSDVTGLHALFRRFAPLHAAMAEAADAVLVSTDYLAEWVRQMPDRDPAKPIYTLRNFLSADWCERGEAARQTAVKSSEGITLSYVSGSRTHDGDLHSIAEAVRDVLRERPQVTLQLVGPVEPPPILCDSGVNLRRKGFVPWYTVPEVLAATDICLAPLELDVVFNHGKSEIKLLEAAAVGVPTVASASAGFQEALRDFPNAGRLASTPDDWRRYLLELIDSAETRASVARDAQTLLQAQGAEAAQHNVVPAIFAQFAAMERARPVTPRVTRVHWPVSPPKYAAKKVLARWKAVRRR